MGIVLTGEFFEGTGEYELLCLACKKPVGRATRKECAELTCHPADVLCFECEGVDPMDIPQMLAPQLGDRLIVFEPNMNKFVTWEIDDTRAQPVYSLSVAYAIDSLSSSPYLPKSPQKPDDECGV